MSTDQERFYRISQVRENVPTICNLDRLRRSQCGRIDIDGSTISTHDIDFRVCSQPLANTLSLPIRKQTNNFVRLQIHKDSAEALAASPTPIINSNNMHLSNLR